MSKEKTNSRIKDEMQEMEETFKASVVVEDEPWQETACLPPPPPAPGADEASAGAGAPGWRGQVPIITEHLVTDDEPSDESLLCIEEPVVLVAEPYKNPDDTDAECTEDLDEGIEEPDEVGEEAREDSPPPPGGAGDAGGAAALPDLPWGGEAAPATKVDSWVAELVPTPGAIGGAIPRPRSRPPSPPPSPPARPARPAPPAPTGLHDDELDAERARIITEVVTLFNQKSGGKFVYIEKEIEQVKNIKCDTVHMFKMLKILEKVAAELQDMKAECEEHDLDSSDEDD